VQSFGAAAIVLGLGLAGNHHLIKTPEERAASVLRQPPIPTISFID